MASGKIESEEKPESEEIYQVIPQKYKIIRRLTGGKMSQNYLCQTEDGNKYVIKFVKYDQNPLFEKSILQYIISLDGDFIKYHDSFRYKDRYAIVTQYIEGRNMADLINLKIINQQNFENDFLIAFATWLFKNLYILHANGILHRDIKPENIVYDDSAKQFYLIDFGLSCFLVLPEQNDKYKQCDFGIISGSPAYFPPEIFSTGIDQDDPNLHKKYAIDVWAATMTVYCTIFKNFPFELPVGLKQNQISKIMYPLTSGITKSAGFRARVELLPTKLKNLLYDGFTLNSIFRPNAGSIYNMLNI